MASDALERGAIGETGACYPAAVVAGVPGEAGAPAAPGPAEEARAAFVAVDTGSVFTKAYLLDEVEGERRLVAVGRVPTIGDDGQPAPAHAVQRAIGQALAFAGRRLEDGPTAPHAHLTSTHGIPRVLIAAAREPRLREVLAGLEGLPVHVLEPMLLASGGGGAGANERLLEAIETHLPDAVIIPAEAGRTAEARASRAALEALRFGLGDDRPLVVLLSEDTADAALLEGADHALVKPGDPAALARALTAVTAGRQALDVEQEGGRPGAVPGSSFTGIRAATEIVAERYDVDVLTLDLGASHALAVLATGTTGKRRLISVARDDLGLRRGRTNVLALAGADAVSRWLPIDAGESSLRADARRGLMTPAALPESLDALLVEHAFAREALRQLLADLPRALGSAAGGLPPIDLLIGSGGVLACVPRLMQAAMILLDAVQPEALTQLALDRATALPLLGHLGSSLGHGAVGASLERDGLLNLGLCIAPIGTGREGETAIRVEVAYATRSPVTVEVPFGAIEVVPLPIGERASLKLWPSRDFDVGLGRGNAATPRAEVEGGAVGIIIDARGRPLALPESAEKRQAKLLQWLQATHAYPQLSFVHESPGGESPFRLDDSGAGERENGEER